MKITYHNCKDNEDECEIWRSDLVNVWHIVIRYESATIKYCPFCGKKLKRK